MRPNKIGEQVDARDIVGHVRNCLHLAVHSLELVLCAAVRQVGVPDEGSAPQSGDEMDESDEVPHLCVLLGAQVLLDLLGHRQLPRQAVLCRRRLVLQQCVNRCLVVRNLLFNAEHVGQVRGEGLRDFSVGRSVDLDYLVEFLPVLADRQEANVDAFVELGAFELYGDRLGDFDLYLFLLVCVAHFKDGLCHSFLLQQLQVEFRHDRCQFYLFLHQLLPRQLVVHQLLELRIDAQNFG